MARFYWLLTASFGFIVLEMVSSASAATGGDNDGHIQRNKNVVFEYHGGREQQHWMRHWSACGKGRAQSPINIVTKQILPDDRHPHRLAFTYKRAPAYIHAGHALELKWKEDGGFLTLNGVKYKLAQLHFHSPSEHTINGVRFPLEMHIVHEGPKMRRVVVSILYKYEKESRLLATLLKQLPIVMKNTSKEHYFGSVSLENLKLGKKYYLYQGSLTTPPCTEGVIWIIMSKASTVGKKQVLAILNARLGENARPLQPLNGRHVFKHD